MSTPAAAVLLVCVVAALFDIMQRRIPNALTLSAPVAALAFGAITGGTSGALDAAAGWVVGCALFLPWFLLGGMGAGDVKLLAALGAWLGPSGAFWAAMYGGVAGGVLAVCVSALSGYLRQSLVNVWSLLMFWRIAGVRPMPTLTLPTAGGPRLPYALPIAVGAVMALWLR